MQMEKLLLAIRHDFDEFTFQQECPTAQCKIFSHSISQGSTAMLLRSGLKNIYHFIANLLMSEPVKEY